MSPSFPLLVLFLFSSSSLFPSVAGLRLCPRECECLGRADLVDCLARGLERVPPGLPHGTWLLELGGNNLTDIRSRAFGGLWSLRVLVLRDSRIHRLETQAFFSLLFLERLDLSWNQLTCLPADFSSCLSAVKELHLEHNNIQHLPGDSLWGLDSVERLDLSWNQVEVLVPGLFRGLSRLRHLYLQHNRLSSLQQGTMDMLPALQVLCLGNNNISQIEVGALVPLYSLSVLSLEQNNLQHLKFKTFLSLHTTSTHIQLSGNPWSCDCDLHRVFSKILRVRHLFIDDYRNVTCHNPTPLAGASLAWVDSQLCVAETATVLVITVTMLVTVVAAMVMAERTRKRNRGKNWDTESQGQTPPA